MNLSSLVHTGKHHREQPPTSYVPKPQQAMASSLITSVYTPQHLQNSSYTYVTAPQPPPSPPVDEASRCSLPSISSLLGGLPNGSSSEQSRQQTPEQRVSQSQSSDSRPSSNHQYKTPAMSTRGALPPTPPMQSETAFDDQRSPSTASNSSYSIVSAPGYFQTGSVPAINNPEPHSQRQPVLQRRLSKAAAPGPYAQPLFNGPQYHASPAGYYSSPIQPTPPPSQVSGMYYQRPLPQQFPPPGMPLALTLTTSGTNPWQHHHYISPSSAASFPQSQDRYICPTCNKAFSRPSSLRIHSHSHTGEKPFKCPQKGCGKAFSVRSNMKRHERGCHTFEGGGMA